jgi:hypothetical protein
LKFLLIIPIVVLMAAGGCWGVLVAMGLKPHLRELIAAAVICLIAAEVALLPATLLRKSDVLTVSQAGLVGTVIQMFLTLMLAAVAWMAQLGLQRRAFFLMLLAFYWISLIVLALAIAKLIRGASSNKQ